MSDDLEALVDMLAVSLVGWDEIYPQIIDEAEQRGIKMTEEKLRVATRNEMRARGIPLPETIRWRLRIALGGVEQHD